MGNTGTHGYGDVTAGVGSDGGTINNIHNLSAWSERVWYSEVIRAAFRALIRKSGDNVDALRTLGGNHS